MKTTVIFMIVLIMLASGLSIFGFTLMPSFYSTMESAGEVVDVFDALFSNGIFKVIQGIGIYLNDDLKGDYYVLDPDKDTSLILFDPIFENISFLVEFRYRPLKSTVNGAHGFYLLIKTLTGSNKDPKIYLGFDSRGEFVRALVFSNNKIYSTTSMFTTSYFSKYSEIVKLVFTEPDFNLIDGGTSHLQQFACNIFCTPKGSFNDLISKYKYLEVPS